MRAATLLVQLTFFTVAGEESGGAEEEKPSPKGLVSIARGRRSAKRRLSRKLRASAGMVVGPIFQFLKRVFQLIVGLLRLTYRKVREDGDIWCVIVYK